MGEFWIRGLVEFTDLMYCIRGANYKFAEWMIKELFGLSVCLCYNDIIIGSSCYRISTTCNLWQLIKSFLGYLIYLFWHTRLPHWIDWWVFWVLRYVLIILSLWSSSGLPPIDRLSWESPCPLYQRPETFIFFFCKIFNYQSTLLLPHLLNLKKLYRTIMVI
jgi:hypothetical protein